MMKKFTLIFMIMMVVSAVLAGCEEMAVVEPDYTTAEMETALNNGELLEGKTVTIEVIKYEPASAFGYNIQTGEHMNFVSVDNPGVEEGDIITVRVVKAGNVFGSWIITYEQ